MCEDLELWDLNDCSVLRVTNIDSTLNDVSNNCTGITASDFIIKIKNNLNLTGNIGDMEEL